MAEALELFLNGSDDWSSHQRCWCQFQSRQALEAALPVEVEGIAMSQPVSQTSSPISRPESITAVELHMMPRDEVVTLYHQLDAPTFKEMHGEFAASLLDQGHTIGYLASAFAMNVKGRWLCKGFEPSGPNEGHGYNSFMTPRGVRRSARMRTHIGPSKLPGDTKDAFHLEYADFNDFQRGGLGGGFLHTMFDEVRKVRAGLYLGIGQAGFTKKARSEPHPFILEGPVARFMSARL